MTLFTHFYVYCILLQQPSIVLREYFRIFPSYISIFWPLSMHLSLYHRSILKRCTKASRISLQLQTSTFRFVTRRTLRTYTSLLLITIEVETIR